MGSTLCQIKHKAVCQEVLRNLKSKKYISSTALLFNKANLNTSKASVLLNKMVDEGYLVKDSSKPIRYSLNMINIEKVNFYLMYRATREDVITSLSKSERSRSFFELYNEFYMCDNVYAVESLTSLLTKLKSDGYLKKTGKGIRACFTLNRNSNYKMYVKVEE